MFPKNQNLYLIIYNMFVSQALRNLPRQEDCFGHPQEEYKYKLICNRVIHESEIVCVSLNKNHSLKHRLDLGISI
jgi:hypothetical protein